MDSSDGTCCFCSLGCRRRRRRRCCHSHGSSDDDSDDGRWPLPPEWTAAVSRRTGLRYWANRETGEQSRSHPGRRAGRYNKEDRLAQGAAVLRGVAISASSGAKKQMLRDRDRSRRRSTGGGGGGGSRRNSFGSGGGSPLRSSPRRGSGTAAAAYGSAYDADNWEVAGDDYDYDEDEEDRPRLDPAEMKLRKGNGKHRHYREFSLEAGRLTVHEKKHWCPGVGVHACAVTPHTYTRSRTHSRTRALRTRTHSAR
jgi:hypothetical protein